MKTIHQPRAFHPDICELLYQELRDTIPWETGIPSRRHGFTRKAYSLGKEVYPEIDKTVLSALEKMGQADKWVILGYYLNYYENGQHFTPNHTHKGTGQLIISLGATRTLELNKKRYALGNGDAILFGAGLHGVPREPEVTEGRISIATFMMPKTSVETDGDLADLLFVLEL